MAPDEDDGPEDRPEVLPEQQSAVSPKERRKRENVKQREERENREWLQRALKDPAGRRFVWSILQAAGAFEEKYGFGPNGFPNTEATWRYLGQHDLGQRFYHSWSVLDRAGMLSLLDEFHPFFPKVKR